MEREGGRRTGGEREGARLKEGGSRNSWEGRRGRRLRGSVKGGGGSWFWDVKELKVLGRGGCCSGRE